ncbi:MAG: OB-fold nucleic acid binding domain-containing protein, partial [Desulfocucumaceae bacterium]
MTRIFVSDIKNGMKIISRFVVKGKKMNPFKGKPGYFMTLFLADRTGQIEAKMWEKAEDANLFINPGDLLEIKGSVLEYNGALQVTISSYRVCPDSEFNPADFLPSSPRDTAEMLVELKGLVDSIKNNYLKKLLTSFFEDEDWLRGFCIAPAAKANHQAYLGGLLEHTLNVSR